MRIWIIAAAILAYLPAGPIPARAAEPCPFPAPHYLLIGGACTPSCGVLLAGRDGRMEAKKCSTGWNYAGFTWEESKHRSKCCVKRQATPSPSAPAAQNCDIPPLNRINVHMRTGNGSRMIADATPIVCSTDPGTKHERYCQTTMNDPNRRCCPTKPEGHPMRVPCELLLLGSDVDGIPGPRWSFSGNGSVEKRSDNPFLAFAYGSGTVTACSNKVDVCGSGVVNLP